MVAKAGVAKDKAHELLSILALRVRVELWEGAAMLAVKLKAECIPTPEGSVSRRQAGVYPRREPLLGGLRQTALREPQPLIAAIHIPGLLHPVTNPSRDSLR